MADEKKEAEAPVPEQQVATANPEAEPPKRGRGRPPKDATKEAPKVTNGVKLKVLHGTFVCGPHKYRPGETFTLDRAEADYLLATSVDVEKA